MSEMELRRESSGQALELNRGKRSWSLEDSDSNALILPEKKRNKKKGVDKECKRIRMDKNPKLSKAQKRKLKKLEEEKEKALWLSKSIETLEKYKLPEDAFHLLLSSRDIGRAETMKEKHRRAVHFSKAGLEVPDWDKPFERKGGDSATGGTELEGDGISLRQDFNEDDSLQPMILRGEAPKILSKTDKIPSRKDFNKDDLFQPMILERESQNYESVPLDSSQGAVRCIENSGSDKADVSQKVDYSGKFNTQGCPAQEPLSIPTVVHVSRPNEIQNTRKDLPIVMMEQEIMEAINDHSAVIICGETGCGKTTQVPQFLYEAGFGSSQSSTKRGIIGVTQPRRVAVLATAKRVAFELGFHLGQEVGFQVRYDKRIGESCSIKFMTDGILLREVQNDFLLKRYSVIILDEAHERSLNTDILIGMLSRIIKIRQDEYEKQQQIVRTGQSVSPDDVISPLKLVLMSATLRVEDFISGRRIFNDPPPVIEVPTRQYPVTIHFSKRTEIFDYIGQAYKKVLAIHKRLPHGGILVFVTGQREVNHLCRKLSKASKELVVKTLRKDVGTDGTGVSQTKSVEDINMKEINDAFDFDGNSIHQYTDRFSSYEEDECDIDEDDSDVSYDSETESELEIDDDVDGDPSRQTTKEDDRNLLNVLGEDGSLASLKAAFETLAGKPALNSSDGKHAPLSSPEGCLDQSNPSIGNKRGEKDPSLGNKRGEKGFCAGILRVLPLYAKLSAADQLCVFKEVQEGERLVVVATNVAETSITIPGIKYIVDTGREKVKAYNSSNGMETYQVQWISKASAAQRAGRAGRTGPGHCYRLYSSAVFSNILPDFSLAEISKMPVDGVVLLMKSMRIDKVQNFPFPTPPKITALVEAEQCLKALEALHSNGKLTPLGKAMARFPMSPRHSRMLLTVIQTMRMVNCYARANLVLGYAVAAAAALSLSNPVVLQFEGSDVNKDDLEHDEKSGTQVDREVIGKQEKLRRKKQKETAKMFHAKFSNPNSDTLTIAYALQCFELSGSPVEFCNDNALHLKTMEEMSNLRRQLLQLIFEKGLCGTEQDFSWIHGTQDEVERAWRVSSNNPPLLLNEEELLGQAICAGWVDRVAKRIRGASRLSEGDTKTHAVRYQACMVKETVFLHRWSSVSSSAPEFLVYSELLQTKRPYMYGVTSVKPEWLVKYASSLCTFSSVLTDPKPYYEPQSDQVFCYVIPTFGPHLWELPLHSLPITNDMQRVTVFAYALLEGKVLPCLGSVRKFMSAPPSSILRPQASGQKRVGNLLNKLKTKLIDSCSMLREVWMENPNELHSEILGWFQESFHKHFQVLWSKMHGEILLEPQERFPKRGRVKSKSKK
ncbi:hypothetical protein F2P56_024899 [Juglans regia]|uniref:RNA helicase n=2 Tax=Juglans regia TaxID=51240 RepID=A0A833X9H0_JUGRE|nr:ATP-dependent RNA helicase DEAH13 [Juglans regia]KAF5455305.1 hypothetical protein F2P56_024899 [Juglans regia]